MSLLADAGNGTGLTGERVGLFMVEVSHWGVVLVLRGRRARRGPPSLKDYNRVSKVIYGIHLEIIVLLFLDGVGFVNVANRARWWDRCDLKRSGHKRVAC